MALQKLADLLRATDRAAAAMPHARRAQDLLETLAEADPDMRLELARNEVRLGLLDDPAEAERHHRRAIAIYEALAADQPDRPDLLAAMAQARFNLGSLLAARGEFAAACETPAASHRIPEGSPATRALMTPPSARRCGPSATC